MKSIAIAKRPTSPDTKKSKIWAENPKPYNKKIPIPSKIEPKLKYFLSIFFHQLILYKSCGIKDSNLCKH